MGNGTVRSWATFSKGKLTAVGITFTETALSGLQQELPKGDPRIPGYEFPLALPNVCKSTPFDHVSIDWNPKGHVPKGIYDVPHFDCHFYLISQEARKKITLIGSDMAKCQKKPNADFIPANYQTFPETEVPQMGKHWVDVTSPELSGSPFTNTFIYGFYDAKTVFVEPMISLAFFESKPNATFPIKLPKYFPKHGTYPTRYSVRYNPVRQEYTVALEAMTGK